MAGHPLASMPAPPSCARARAWPRASPLAPAALSAAVAGLTWACVFTPPPPLPGEEPLVAEVEPSGRGSGPAIQGRKGGAAGGDPDGAGQGSATEFRRGQEPPVGMSLADIQAFNAAQGDPVAGFYELDQALAGIPEEGELWAEIVTPRGVIDCRLFEDLTPTTVANFVGLARGLRPWYDRDREAWIEGEPYYDDTTFHRVIPGFMIQGGDPTGTGRGNPGYVVPDEIHPELGHDGGALSMANKGANTGSAQFFVVLEPAVHLDGSHTVFGRCTPEGVAVANEIANVAVGANDKPVEDERVQTIRIVRRPAADAD